MWNCCAIVVDADDQLDEVCNSSVPSVQFLLKKKDVDCVRDDYSRGRPMSLFQLIDSVSFSPVALFHFCLFPFRRAIFHGRSVVVGEAATVTKRGILLLAPSF